MTTTTRLVQDQAPCGKTVDGREVRDDDEDGFVIDHVYWDCGCRMTRHQFHDGSIQVKVFGHRGKILHRDKILTDEHSAQHEA